MNAEILAQMFHEAYERLAPEHGYDTRKDSAVAWEAVPEANKKLMIAVCGEILAKLEIPVRTPDDTDLLEIMMNASVQLSGAAKIQLQALYKKCPQAISGNLSQAHAESLEKKQ